MRPASAAEKARLAGTFTDLCRIPSPSWQETACAEYVQRELHALGLTVERDEAGNLLARIPGRPAAGSSVTSGPGAARADSVSSAAGGAHGAAAGGDTAGAGVRTVLLCAHLDTVPPVAPVEPVLIDDGWQNANAGILGADNKSAVATIVEVARRCVVEGSPVTLELVFTVAEEVGLEGAKRFDATRLRAEFGYVFDHATPIGEIVVASPTLYRIEAEFHGKSAHAGLRPEEGHSAVLAAARAVLAMPHGRIDEQTTANVGYLLGGVESTNVVPERARLLAEVRSLDADVAETTLAAAIDAIGDAASLSECDVDVITTKQVTGYRQRPSAPAIAAAEAALRACGFEPKRIATAGASDANVFEAAGLPTVNVANGTEHNHEPTERVSVSALEGMLDVTFALLQEAAAV